MGEVVWTQQVKEKGERCSILFYDRKTMALVGAVRTRASARNVRKQLGRALEIMAEPSATPLQGQTMVFRGVSPAAVKVVKPTDFNADCTFGICSAWRS